MSDSLEHHSVWKEIGALRSAVDKLEAKEAVRVVEASRALFAVTDEALAATKEALKPLGVHQPPEDIVVSWLQIVGDADLVMAGVNAILERHKEDAEHFAGPDPTPGADWREPAAYLEVTDSHSGWTRITTYLMTGEGPCAETSLDPLPSIFAGVSHADGPNYMAPLVPEVVRRSELGISWAGTQALGDDDLNLRKAILGRGPGSISYPPELTAYKDARLARVLFLTNVLPLQRPLFTGYPMPGKDRTLEDWLFAQYKTSRPWPASPAWH